jgi:hypothetical protein
LNEVKGQKSEGVPQTQILPLSWQKPDLERSEGKGARRTVQRVFQHPARRRLNMTRSTAMKVSLGAALLLTIGGAAIALALLSDLMEPKTFTTALGTAFQVVVGISVIPLVAIPLGLGISIVGLGLTLGLAMAILSPLFFLTAAYQAVRARRMR